MKPWKALTPKTARELTKAFADNPIRGRELVAGNRWRFVIKVFEFIPPTEVQCDGVEVSLVGGITLVFESEREAAKVTRGVPVLIEAELDTWAPGVFYGNRFVRGVVIGPPPPPPPPPPPEEAGVRDFDQAAAKMLVDGFDESPTTRARFARVRWRFAGTAQPQAGSGSFVPVRGLTGVKVLMVGKKPARGKEIVAEGTINDIRWDGDTAVLCFTGTDFK